MHALQLSDPIQLPLEKRSVAQTISAGILKGTENHRARLVMPNGEELELPTELLLLMRDVTAALARGEPVSIVPLHRELTTQETAELLNMSRQHLVNLLEAGQIPFTRPGKHRRIRAADVLAYKAKRDAERREALRELTRLSEEAGDYFGDTPPDFKRLDE